MSDSLKKNVHIDIIQPAAFLAALRRLAASQRSAELEYLLCKAALQRRRRELKQCVKRGDDTSRLERVISRLETSMRAHESRMSPRPGRG